MRDWKISRDKDGVITKLLVPDAHTLYVESFIRRNIDGGVVTFVRGRTDTFMLASLDELSRLKDVLGDIRYKQWAINDGVVSDLRNRGESVHNFGPFKFQYRLRKTKYADNLRHDG